jgi:hypothetical protein
MGLTRVEHFLVSPLGYAPALLANIRLGQKGLSGTNTLAYLASSSMTEGKVFNTPTLGINV